MITLESKSRRITPTDLASFSRELGRKLAADDGDPTAVGLWLYMSTVLERAEVFEFGVVDDRRLRAEGERGGDLMSRGLLSLPYPTVIYWYDLLPDPEVVTDLGNRVVDMIQQGDPDETLRFCTIASHHEGIVFAADFLRLLGPRHVYSMAVGARFFAGNRGDWQGQPITIGVPCRSEREKTGLIESCVSGVIGLSMILATRGIPLRREEPPPKVNAKRLKAGKPPLTRITFVDCNKYYEAHDNTAKGGTHASPVPHLRRGHIRHYQNGKEIWIRDMIVNARSMDEIDKRERYDVTKH